MHHFYACIRRIARGRIWSLSMVGVRKINRMLVKADTMSDIVASSG
jgi:hypothetical protein